LGGATHRREAAKRQRILDPARRLALQEIAAVQQRQHDARGLGLARRGPERHGARIDRREVGAGGLEGQCAGNDLGIERQAGIVQHESAKTDAVAVVVQQGDRILGAKRRRLDTGAAQRLRPGLDATAELCLAVADQGQEELRHRAEVGLAQRADAADARVHGLVQHVADHAGEDGRQA
jgi:hypothetical protein